MYKKAVALVIIAALMTLLVSCPIPIIPDDGSDDGGSSATENFGELTLSTTVDGTFYARDDVHWYWVSVIAGDVVQLYMEDEFTGLTNGADPTIVLYEDETFPPTNEVLYSDEAINKMDTPLQYTATTTGTLHIKIQSDNPDTTYYTLRAEIGDGGVASSARITQIDTYFLNGDALEEYRQLTYDQDDNLTRMDRYDSLDAQKDYDLYYYDYVGRLVGTENYDVQAGDVKVQETTVSYDVNGFISRVDYWELEEGVESTGYEEYAFTNGQLTTIYNYDETGTFVYQMVFLYDTVDQLERIEAQAPDGTVMEYILILYHTDGTLASVEAYAVGDPDDVFEWSDTYTYDSQGLLDRSDYTEAGDEPTYNLYTWESTPSNLGWFTITQDIGVGIALGW